MSAFVEIPASFLASISTGNERIPAAYFTEHGLARKVFWRRLRAIHRLIERQRSSRRSCLDFGAGGGVFLPTLARLFEEVVAVDLHVTEALRVAGHFGLDNVRIVAADACRADLPEAPFDAIVAADVLEHFADLAPPVEALKRNLHREGLLFTSLPTENWLYVTLRRIFGVEKPEDHYHTAREVERYLEAEGFRAVARRYVPLRVRLAPLYHVTAWRRGASQT